MISSLLSHGELFIHSREARNEHLLSVPLGSFSDALCFIYLIYQLEYVLYCIVLYLCRHERAAGERSRG